MNIIFDAQLCTGDGTCAVACPLQIIKLTKTDSFKFQIIEPLSCIGCGICIQSCEQEALNFDAFTEDVIDLKKIVK
ncbi:Putative_ferredoxin [Hexamita inflata]|uniref:Ferredoxin n=1 Tax=Hexamita inflata TaxID=28002 RepID=A0AA86TK29_9EUKA|nr:Putative ferredoxin [Hexamita inflata]CAI9919631.1 Putative ferredoxin [Hexamita inflata]CAI9976384.1 Putative ferredoxin [Hexamita inflata]